MDRDEEEMMRRRRRRYQRVIWPPWNSPFYRLPPEVFYPGLGYDPYYPMTIRRTPEEEIAMLEDALKDLEAEREDILQDIEDLKKRIKKKEGEK